MIIGQASRAVRSLGRSSAASSPLALRASRMLRGGRRRRRSTISGLGDLGDVTPSDLRAQEDKYVGIAVDAFENATTNAAHYKVIQPYLDLAERNLALAGGQVPVSAARKSELALIVTRLRNLRNAAKVRYANQPNDPPPDRAQAEAAVTDLIAWSYGIVGTALAESNAAADTVRQFVEGVKPKNLLPNLLGLPSWFLPVALGVGGLLLVGNVVAPLRALIPSRR